MTWESAPVLASYGAPAGSVPWAVHVLAMRGYHRKYGTDQSAVRIAERGGLSWAELIACLRDEAGIDGVKRADAELREAAS